MPTPHPTRPSYPPPPGTAEAESDESLALGVRGGPDHQVAQSTALLIARHWKPVHDYAVICLDSAASVSAMVTGAAFHQVLDRLKLGEPGTALRPRLLVTVRDTALLWAGTERLTGVLPALRKPSGARALRAAGAPTPDHRTLTAQSFEGLPAVERSVLWHVEVEAEPVAVAAVLLGIPADTAAAALDGAREKLRDGIVRAHRELAPSKDCRFHNRLLDVPLRRGRELLPDVRRHLDDCRYCRAAAEQLSHFERELGLLLAESVLGLGAQRYLETRPGRLRQQPALLRGSARHRGGRPRGTRRRLRDRVPASVRRVQGAKNSPRALLTGVGLASAGLLATLLAAGMWSDGGGADPAASTSATGGGALPGTGAQAPATGAPTTPGTGGATGVPKPARLRNTASGLCLATGAAPQQGSGVELAVCSADRAQQWTYENDGQLRSVAAPELCLDSHADAGVVILGACAEPDSARADDVRYDLTVQGELLPRWDEALALAPVGGEAGADLVAKVRDGSSGQRWRTDPVAAGAGSLSIRGTAGASARQVGLTDRTA
ncbi:ricin-type beta-trefoil lectin domain protein [Streptomyces sp. bgisy154]|uniref:ricin-type beta-trefoil lectin domain protein n=1 Tax=Streptomyces sp. bgisy154 TaxID=3413794 RepID=UPI003D73B346